MRATPFLYFKGDCESALQFYRACGLGKVVELRRIEGTPLAERDGPSWNQKVLFSRFEGRGIRLCASDGADSEPMKGCAIYLEVGDAAAAEKLFDTLSADASPSASRSSSGAITTARCTARFPI